MAVPLASSARADGIRNPKTLWRFQTQGPIRGPAAVSGDRIFFGSADGFVYAVEKSDGALAWKFETGGAVVAGTGVSESMVYVSSRDGAVYALDRASGELRWKFAMEPLVPVDTEWEFFAAAPVVAGGRALVGSGDGHLYALDADTGELAWKFKTNGRVRATPLVARGVVYQPSNDNFVYALSEADGALLWKFETEGASHKRDGFTRSDIFTQPSLEDGLLVFGSRDANVYALRADTGELAWKFNYDTTWAMATSVADGIVYVGWSTNDLVCALDLATGKEKWQLKSGAHTYATPRAVGDALYFGSADGKLYRVDAATGAKRWEYDLGSEIYSGPVHDGGLLYVGSDDGSLRAIGEGAPSRKAVFEPAKLEGSFPYVLADAAISPYLSERGFERLDSADALVAFLSARADDKAPSVVVFAIAYIPDTAIGDEPGSGLLRRYLENGGKVVWLGGHPGMFVFDEKGAFVKRDTTAGARLLDTAFIEVEDSGSYYSRSTQAGLNLGLPAWFRNTFSFVEEQAGVIPLAIDEYGRIGPWMKRFSESPGSGFISCRTWAYNTAIREADLAILHELATSGLE